jgi:hypothetical protein
MAIVAFVAGAVLGLAAGAYAGWKLPSLKLAAIKADLEQAEKSAVSEARKIAAYLKAKHF